MSNPFTAVLRFVDDVACIGYDAVTYLFTGGPTHDYDTPIAAYCPNCGETAEELLNWKASSVYCANCKTTSTYCSHCGADSGSCDGSCREPLDGADRLAEAEAEQEVWEPQDMQPDILPDWDDTPEPQLSADELVAVRELIEERFPNFVDRPASVEHTPDSAPDAGHPNHLQPTSKLLSDAADMICHLALGDDAYKRTRPGTCLALCCELRDRAEAIEDEN